MVAPTTKRWSRRFVRWRMSKSPWKVYVLLFLMLVSTVSSVRAGDLKNTGSINNRGQVRVKNAAIGLPAANGGLYEFFGGNQTIPAREFQNLKLSGSGVIKASEGNITVDGTLTITPSVVLATGGSTVHLAGAIDEQGYLQGNMDKTVSLIGAIGSSNFGNIGLTLSWSGVAPGNTTVVRTTGTTIFSAATGKQSIRRYFDITPTVNTGLNGTLVFKYADVELNGQNANTLSLWRSIDGGATWRDQGGTVDVGTKTITKTGVLSFSRWTASDASNPLGPTQLEWVAQNIASTAGNAQTATAGTALSPFVVTVTDGYGNPVAGIPVTFALGGVPTGATGQALSVTSATTGSNGQASTVLTLGNVAGSYSVTATSAGLAGSPITFAATAIAPPVATTLAMASGNNQSGVVGTTVSLPLTVTVFDQYSAPMPGVTVKFTMTSVPAGATGQALSDTSVVTNASGQAKASLMLGDKIGSYVVAASCGSLTGSPLTFTAAATAGAAVTLLTTSGSGQSGMAGTQLTNPFVVSVVDSFGNPVSGKNVRFAFTTVPPGSTGQKLSDALVMTNTSGQASTQLKLGTKAGVYAVAVSSDSLAGSPQSFSATALAGAPAFVNLPSGSSLNGQVGTTLGQPFVVAVTDSFGNPISGLNIRFAMTLSPAGAVGESPKDTTVVTDGQGQSSTLIKIGTKSGVYTLAVTVGSMSPRVITITAAAGAAVAMAVTSGDGQSGVVSTSLAQPMVVTLTDGFGNPVSGVKVSFVISTLPSGATGQLLSVASITTDANGQASTLLTLGNKAGLYVVAALTNGLPAVTFNATATGTTPAVVATRLVQTSGNGQSGVIGSQLANPFVVTVLDQFGNPFVGATVNFAIAGVPSGDTSGVLTSTTAVTSTSGQASTYLKLGTKAGAYTVTASSGSLTGSPLTFTATATATTPGLVASRLMMTSGNGQSGVVGAQLANPFVVTVADSAGNPVAGTSVRFTFATVPVGSTGESLTDTVATTDVSGQASTYLKLGTKAGAYTVTASSGNLAGSPVTFTATATATTPGLVASRLITTSGDGQSGVVGSQLANPFVVMVVDSAGNPVAGTTVRFAIATVPIGSTGETLTDTVATTDVNGQASTHLKLGTRAGVYTVTASSGSLTGSPQTFGAAAVAGAPAVLAMTSGDGQVAQVNAQVPVPLVVTVTDDYENVVSGAVVNFAFGTTPSGATGQLLSATSVVTGINGQASTQLTLGDSAGVYTVTATASGLRGSPVTFTATATGKPPVVVATRLLQTSGNGQSGRVGTQLADPFVVTVLDQFGNPFAGATVNFAIAGAPLSDTSAMLTNASVVTNASGEASTKLTLGKKAGHYTVTASSGSLTGSPQVFIATAIAAKPALLSMVTGNEQSGTVKSAVSQPLVVSVADTFGNPVSGASVRFVFATVPTGATGQLLSVAVTSTDASGQASAGLLLGNKPGEYRIEARSDAIPGQVVNFLATAVVGAARSLVLTSGQGQRGVVRSTLPEQFIVMALDAEGNAVPGVSVQFAIESTPVGANGHSLSRITVVTDTLGNASTLLTLGDVTGIYSVIATSAGLTGSPLTLRAVASLSSGAVSIAYTAGDAQVAPVLTQIANPLVATVLDAEGKPVVGQAVTFAIDSLPQGALGQVMTPTTATTDAQGRASSVLTFGSKVGVYKVTASVAGLGGSPVEFRLGSTVGAPKLLAYVQGNNQARRIGSTLDTAFVAKVFDAGQNPVPGVAVQFAIDSVPSGATGQALRVTSSTTDPQGQASAELTLGRKVGVYVVSASATGLDGRPIKFRARATAGAPAVMAMTSGNEQTANVSTELAAPFVVTVVDNGGNAVQGVNVQFAVETTPAGAQGQSLRVITPTTDAQGQASAVLMLGDKIGRYTVIAAAAGLSAVTFGATATVLIGDINRDKSIDIADLTTIIDHILGKLTLTGYDSVKADFNKDGRIDVADVVAMQNYLLAIEVSGLAARGSETMSATGSTSTPRALSDSAGVSEVRGEFVLTENGVRFNLTNSIPIKGLQLIVRFKDALSIPQPDVFYERALVSDFYFNASSKELRIVAYNLRNAPIAAGDGPLFRLPIILNDVNAIESGQLIVSKTDNVALFDEALTKAVTVRLVKPQELPVTFVLYQNYPNPFNGQTNIKYDVMDAQGYVDVTVQVYNVLGEKVKTLVSASKAGGTTYTVVWDGTDERGSKLSSGAYYYRLISGSFVSSKRMILLK